MPLPQDDVQFECPLTHERTTDPVIAAEGYTCERASIKTWLVRNHASPSTDEPLAHRPRPTIVRALVLCILWTSTVCSADHSHMSLVWLNTADTKCVDGTDAGFYIRLSAEGPANWVIFLSQGGFCDSAESCATLLAGEGDFRAPTSLGYPQHVRGLTLLSTDEQDNPEFARWNHVYIPQCSADMFLGNTEQGSLFFHGASIFRAVMFKLESYGLNYSACILLAGASAGGTGVQHHINWLGQQHSQAHVMGIVDSSWWLQSMSTAKNDLESSSTMVRKLMSYWNASFDQRCTAARPTPYHYLCFFPAVNSIWLQHPILYVQSLYDQAMVTQVKKRQLATQDEDSGSTQFLKINGAAFATREEMLNWPGQLHSFVAIACATHPNLLGTDLDTQPTRTEGIGNFAYVKANHVTGSTWNHLQVNGTSLKSLIGLWHSQVTTGAPNLRGWFDSCNYILCNPSCPQYLVLSAESERDTANTDRALSRFTLWYVTVVVVFAIVQVLGYLMEQDLVNASSARVSPSMAVVPQLKCARAPTEVIVHPSADDCAPPSLPSALSSIRPPSHLPSPPSALPPIFPPSHLPSPPSALPPISMQSEQHLSMCAVADKERNSFHRKSKNQLTNRCRVRKNSFKELLVPESNLCEAAQVQAGICVDALSFCVNVGKVTEKFLLKNITLNIQPGSFTALMGPSGSGKSTLLDILSLNSVNGLVTCKSFTAGHLDMQNQKTQRLFRKQMQYVPQANLFCPQLTVMEHMWYLGSMCLGSICPEQRKAKIFELLDLLGLSACAQTPIGDGGHTAQGGLSGGELRRLMVASALIAEPTIIIMDEVTSGLDAGASLALCKLLHSVVKRMQITAVMAVHQPREEITMLFDDIIVLYNGGVLYHGIPSKFTDLAVDSKLYSIETQVPRTQSQSHNQQETATTSLDILFDFLYQAKTNQPISTHLKQVVIAQSVKASETTKVYCPSALASAMTTVLFYDTVLCSCAETGIMFSWAFSRSSSKSVLSALAFRQRSLRFPRDGIRGLLGCAVAGAVIGLCFYDTVGRSSKNDIQAPTLLPMAIGALIQAFYFGSEFMQHFTVSKRDVSQGHLKPLAYALFVHIRILALALVFQGAGFGIVFCWLTGMLGMDSQYEHSVVMVANAVATSACIQVFIMMCIVHSLSFPKVQLGMVAFQGISCLFSGALYWYADQPVAQKCVTVSVHSFWTLLQLVHIVLGQPGSETKICNGEDYMHCLSNGHMLAQLGAKDFSYATAEHVVLSMCAVLGILSVARAIHAVSLGGKMHIKSNIKIDDPNEFTMMNTSAAEAPRPLLNTDEEISFVKTHHVIKIVKDSLRGRTQTENSNAYYHMLKQYATKLERYLMASPYVSLEVFNFPFRFKVHLLQMCVFPVIWLAPTLSIVATFPDLMMVALISWFMIKAVMARCAVNLSTWVLYICHVTVLVASLGVGCFLYYETEKPGDLGTLSFGGVLVLTLLRMAAMLLHQYALKHACSHLWQLYHVEFAMRSSVQVILHIILIGEVRHTVEAWCMNMRDAWQARSPHLHNGRRLPELHLPEMKADPSNNNKETPHRKHPSKPRNNNTLHERSQPELEGTANDSDNKGAENDRNNDKEIPQRSPNLTVLHSPTVRRVRLL